MFLRILSEAPSPPSDQDYAGIRIFGKAVKK